MIGASKIVIAIEKLAAVIGALNIQDNDVAFEANAEYDRMKREQRDALLGLAEWKIQYDAKSAELQDTKGWLLLREKQLAECTRVMREVATALRGEPRDLRIMGLAILADALMDVRAKAPKGRWWTPEKVERLVQEIKLGVHEQFHNVIDLALRDTEGVPE